MTTVDPAQMRVLLADLAGRFNVDAVAECDSTNSELLRRAEQGCPSGTVLVADRQTAGRGRRGRSWLSSPQDGLTFSLLWRFAGPPTRLAGLSLAVGVALARACEALGAHGLGLKWPNDLLWTGPDGFAKVAGILVELVLDRRGTAAVIGIGINLRRPQQPVEQAVAGLSQVLTPLPERHRLLAQLLMNLCAVLDAFATNGFAAVQPEWQARHLWQGQHVAVVQEGLVIAGGTCLGVDAEGALLVDSTGDVQRIIAGDVSLRRS